MMCKRFGSESVNAMGQRRSVYFEDSKTERKFPVYGLRASERRRLRALDTGSPIPEDLVEALNRDLSKPTKTLDSVAIWPADGWVSSYGSGDSFSPSMNARLIQVKLTRDHHVDVRVREASREFRGRGPVQLGEGRLDPTINMRNRWDVLGD